MARSGNLTPPPISAAAPPPAPANIRDSAVNSSHLKCSAFVILSALMSVLFFVEPFADAALYHRLPWPAVVVSLVLLSAFFGATIRLFVCFFLPQPPPALAALAAQPVGVGAISVAAVGIGAVACFIATVGSANGCPPARS